MKPRAQDWPPIFMWGGMLLPQWLMNNCSVQRPVVAVDQPLDPDRLLLCHTALPAPRSDTTGSAMLYSQHEYARLISHLTGDLHSTLDFTGWINPLPFLLKDPHNSSSKKTKPPDEHRRGRSACKLDRQ